MYQDIDKGYMFGYIQTERVAEEYYRGGTRPMLLNTQVGGVRGQYKAGASRYQVGRYGSELVGGPVCPIR
jgi:hypothetical protein